MYELNPSIRMQQDAVRASDEFSAYLRGLARERKRDPGEDLISQLVLVVDEGEQFVQDLKDALNKNRTSIPGLLDA